MSESLGELFPCQPGASGTWAALPVLTKDDLWGPVMARGDNSAVVLVVKGGASEVHYPHSCALDTALVPLLGAKQEHSEPLGPRPRSCRWPAMHS